MSVYTLTKTRFIEGVWEGSISAGKSDAPAPEIVVTHLGKGLRGVTVTDASDPGRWVLRVPVPTEAICDGTQTFLIVDARAEVMMGSFTLIAGDEVAEDIRAEITLLRAELDLLKRAFRRHCVETM